MRPFKHAAPIQFSTDRLEFQNILGISLTRLAAPWGEVPIVATAEPHRITLLYWDDRLERWEAIERPHALISSEVGSPIVMPSWNWSDRVALTSSADTVFLVYKRQGTIEQPAPLVVERFGIEDPTGASRSLRPLGQVDAGTVGQTTNPLGRSLWCGFDATTGRLLVLCQLQVKGVWHLFLLRFRFDAPPGAFNPAAMDLGPGGFDLDAGMHGRQLLAVHRRTPEAFRVPLASLLGQGRVLASGPEADAHYEPLQLASINLDTLAVTLEEVPGGEHPQIQRVDPLLITFDRHRNARLQLDTPAIPLPPQRPRALWQPAVVDKIGWLKQAGSASRGVLLTFDAGVLPRSHAPFGMAHHLFDLQQGLLVHAAAFAFRPVWALKVDATRTELKIDILHHREHVGLFRTCLTASLNAGAITVTSRSFEVWDIGHGRIRNPEALVPDAFAENRQFAPTGRQDVSNSPFAAVIPSAVDNAIGGHLTADLAHDPGGFFAYTDLGDGGLRVIFAQKRSALPDPPPILDEKVITPEQVTGPHLTCEEWVDLRAADWSPSELLAYPVGLIRTTASLGGTLEVPIDFLLDAAAQTTRADGTPLLPLEGLSDADLDLVDVGRLRLTAPQVQVLTASDGRIVTVTVAPGTPVDGIPFAIDAQVAGVAVPVFWTFQPLDREAFLPAGPLAPGAPFTLDMRTATTNPTAMTVPTFGQWRVSIFLLDGPALPLDARPAAAFDLLINPSIRAAVWQPYDAIGETRFYRAQQLTVSLLHYVIDYTVAEDGRHLTVAIRVAPKRATELRFLGGGTEQGTVDYRATIAATPADVRLKGAPGLLFAVRQFSIAFAYGRPFTCGMLMRDQRAADVLTGRDLAPAPFEVVRRTEPLRHAAVGGKPIGDSSTSTPEFALRLETTPGAVTLGTIVGALAVFGLFSLAATIAFFFQLVVVATAAGIAGVVAAAVAAAVLLYLLIEVLPRTVESVVKAEVQRRFDEGIVRDQIDETAMLRYAGEGMAEAIARQALKEAVGRGLAVTSPADTGETLGHDRFRGQTFQIVFVTEEVCRVLLRLERCDDDITIPDPEGPGDDGGPGTIPGVGRAA